MSITFAAKNIQLMCSGCFIELHSMNKKYFQAPFWCFSLSKIGDSSQYLEGPVSAWKDQERNILFQQDPNIPFQLDLSILFQQHPNIPFQQDPNILFQ